MRRLSCSCGAKLHFSEDLEGNGSSSASIADGDDADAASASASGTGNGNASTGEVTTVVQPRLSSFSSRLKSQHHDLCPWNGNPCPEDFLQLPLMAVGDLLAGMLYSSSLWAVHGIEELGCLVTLSAVSVSLLRQFAGLVWPAFIAFIAFQAVELYCLLTFSVLGKCWADLE